jgi:hypothetical protein
MNPLTARKQLLLAESELNRLQADEDLAALKTGIRTFTSRAKTYVSITAAAAALVAVLVAFRRGKPPEAAAKPSWLQTVIRGAGLVSWLWRAFRSPERDPTGK